MRVPRLRGWKPHAGGWTSYGEEPQARVYPVPGRGRGRGKGKGSPSRRRDRPGPGATPPPHPAAPPPPPCCPVPGAPLRMAALLASRPGVVRPRLPVGAGPRALTAKACPQPAALARPFLGARVGSSGLCGCFQGTPLRVAMIWCKHLQGVQHAHLDPPLGTQMWTASGTGACVQTL